MEPYKPGTQGLALDLSSFQLIRDGQPVKLEKTPMELLRLLVRRRGALVTREEIIASIWGDEVHVDVEAGVNTAIRKIRQALEDNADSPRYLETVVGKGYRFVGAIEVVDPEVPVRSATSAPSKRSGPWVWLAVLALALVAVFLVARFSSQNRTSAVSKDNAGRIIIGVARLQNLSPDSGQDYFAEGLTDEILTQLGQLNPERLGVMRYVSQENKQGFQSAAADPGQKATMQYLLEGSVRREQEQARISIRLVRVADGTTSWTESFDRQVGDTLSLQSEIAQRVGRQLQIQVLGHAVHKPANPEAVDAYLRGRFELSRHRIPVPDLARLNFEYAIALDSSYAPAYAGLADFYRSRGVSSDETAAEDWPLAEQNAARALSLDPENAEAHAAMAQIKLMHDWDWAAAREHAQRALQLNPSSPEAHSVYARYLRIAGDTTEAVSQRKQAAALDPLRVDLAEQLVLEYYLARDYKSGVEVARRALADDSDRRFAHSVLCVNLGRLKQFDESVAECSKFLTLEGHAGWISAYEREYHAHGYEAATRMVARKELEDLRKQAKPDLWEMVNDYAAAGMKEETIQLLLRRVAIHDPGLLQIRVDPDFDLIRDDPRYAELVRQIGFPSE
jgi:TolB-like protein/DNA-binding winged helix-turn-helix (wHTH) protein